MTVQVGGLSTSRAFFFPLFFSFVCRVPAQVDAKRIYREMYILRHMQHEEIIHLKDVIMPPAFEDFRDLYLVSSSSFGLLWLFVAFHKEQSLTWPILTFSYRHIF